MHYLSTIELLIILSISFFVSLFICYIYKLYVERLNLFIIVPNHRSSHAIPTPTGAGITISFIYVTSLFLLIYFNKIHSVSLIVFINLGAILATLFGFYDDIKDSSSKSKLILQIFLGFWILYIFANPIFTFLQGYSSIILWIDLFILLFLLVWFSNAINFMDGINGMLTSGIIIILLSASSFIFFQEGSDENVILLLLLASVSIAFLFFNFPIASIFMGDSGSLFFGYMISCLAIKTIIDGDLSFWTWAILLGYFFTEPTVTTILRLKLSRYWYRAHRSCAYQNVARELGNHTKVTMASIIFHLFWLFPLAFTSIYYDNLGLILYLLAIFPVIIFTFRYGPLYSNK
jgi:Fuc2NAc and GlcNAc transferase